MTITAEMRNKAHSPAANRKRVATIKRLLRWKKMQGIPAGQKLKPHQMEQYRAAPMGYRTARQRMRGAHILGSVPLSDLDKRASPKAQAKRKADARHYITTKRVELAGDVVHLVKDLRAKGQSALAAKFIHVIGALVNGGA